MRRIASWFLLLSFCGSALGVQEYYSIYRSYRALGMGGAFYGDSDDESALFYNPAGLALYRGAGQLMVSVGSEISAGAVSAVSSVAKGASGGAASLVNALTNVSGTPVYGRGSVMPYYVRRGFAIGVLVGDVKGDVALLGSNLASQLDVTAIADSGVFVGYAQAIGRHFFLGATVKGMYRAGGHRNYSLVDISNSASVSSSAFVGTGAGVDADLGAQYEWGNAQRLAGGFGLALSNLAASQFPMARTRGGPPGLVRMISLGSHLDVPLGSVVRSVRFLVDVAELGLGGESDPDLGARSGAIWKHINFGAELPVKGWLFLRGGFHQGDYTLGVGVALPVVKIDFATYGEELLSNVTRLTSRRFALRLAFGIGG